MRYMTVRDYYQEFNPKVLELLGLDAVRAIRGDTRALLERTNRTDEGLVPAPLFSLELLKATVGNLGWCARAETAPRL